MKTDDMNPSVALGERVIPYTLYRTDRKHLKIVVSPDLSVSVYAPVKAKESLIAKLVQKKAAWIARKLDLVETFHPLPSPKKYVSGETFVYLGRQYRLKVEQGKNRSAKLRGRYLLVQVKDIESHKESRQITDSWYRNHAKEIFNRYLQKNLAVGERHGIPKPILSIRKMKTRWGSCSSAGRITLNTELVKMPVHCIEYVIMHELCHMLHYNHGSKFYSLLTRCQPDWKARKEVLDRIRLN
ncbi:MAG: M48 family metallopeptidase [Candidatus Aegiribacteria sp.]|nr:M48 family metallopeptidase [Candidatus Aegiribacteria sp.]